MHGPIYSSHLADISEYRLVVKYKDTYRRQHRLFTRLLAVVTSPACEPALADIITILNLHY